MGIKTNTVNLDFVSDKAVLDSGVPRTVLWVPGRGARSEAAAGGETGE